MKQHNKLRSSKNGEKLWKTINFPCLGQDYLHLLQSTYKMYIVKGDSKHKQQLHDSSITYFIENGYVA